MEHTLMQALERWYRDNSARDEALRLLERMGLPIAEGLQGVFFNAAAKRVRLEGVVEWVEERLRGRGDMVRCSPIERRVLVNVDGLPVGLLLVTKDADGRLIKRCMRIGVSSVCVLRENLQMFRNDAGLRVMVRAARNPMWWLIA